MIASTWTDPVIGVDIHIILVPTPAGPVPTPLPCPFMGMVIDPAGMALNLAMGGSTILIDSLPATNCGTAVKNLPPHLPIPGPFQDGTPGNDADLMFGALNVEIGGALAVRLGDIALSCADPARMPTSVVMATPKGSLVLVQPAMVPDLKVIAMTLAFKAVGAAFKAFRAFQKESEFFENLSKKLRGSEENPSRVAQAWDKAVCFLTGHPVDVATGRVLTSQVDLELPGPLALRFERSYDSVASDRDGPLGAGWTHNFGEALWPERGRFVYRGADGREIEFSTLDLPDRVLAPGTSVYVPRERLTLRSRRQYEYVVESADGTVREFFAVPSDPRGRARLVRVRNSVGDEQRFTYGKEGPLETVVDPAGRALRFEHDAAGRLRRVDVVGTDGVARAVVAFEIDASGDLIASRDAHGNLHRYEYVEHLLVKETNRNGLSFYFQYDGTDSTAKCVRTWGDDGIYDHVITYSADGKKTLVENSEGHITLYDLDEAGQVVGVTDALGRKTIYAYDETSGKKNLEADASGAETKREYDARGNLTKLIQPDGAEIALEYGVRDKPVRATDAIGGEWRWSYDESGRLRGRSNPLRETTQFHWNGSRLVSVTDAAGQETRLDYDARGQLVQLTTPDGASTAWSYDALGRVRASTDPNGNERRRLRDELGRVVRLDEPDGNVRQLAYDREGNVVHAVDKHHDVRFEYRGMNRLAARTEADTRVEFHYDKEERLVGIKNEHGYVYRFVLDGAGDVAEEYGFDDLRRRYVRDEAGRVKRVLRPEGQTTEYAYDKSGRVLSAAHSDDTREAYEYRKDGALALAKNDSTELTFERDPLGRLLQEASGEDWVRSSYNALGLRTEVTSSKGLFQKIRRNGMGDVVGVDAKVSSSSGEGGTRHGVARPGGDFSAAFKRDRLGLELERTLPGGIRAEWQRDALGRPIRQEIWRGERSESARQYVWDAGERLNKIIDAFSGPVEYRHDALGNLASATYADGRVDLRMPDAVGNLFRTADRTDRVYGKAGELLEARTARGVTRYAYDAQGNLAKKEEPSGGTWTYQWNAAGMLTKVVRPDGREVSFAYDALGRRVSKTYRGKTTRWIWDGNVPLHEWVERSPDAEDDETQPEQTTHYDGEKALKALLAGRPANGPPNATDTEKAHAATNGGTREAPITWLFEPESFAPLAKIVNGERYGIVTDHLGTPRAMYDAHGDEVWAADIDAYGGLRNLRGARAACPFRWPGQYEDLETGLYYNRFRYYDAEAGGYVSHDPVGLIGGIALYSYTLQPLNYVDPLGLAECAATKVHAFGNKSEPRPPRPGKDILVDEFGMVHPTESGEHFGASTAADPSKAPLTGHFHSIAEGTPMPEGLGITADGSDVGGSHFPGHHTIAPTRSMPYDEFAQKFSDLPWQYAGKK